MIRESRVPRFLKFASKSSNPGRGGTAFTVTTFKEHMSGSGKSWQWYRLSTTVLMLGALSIVLLLWVERVSNKLQMDENLSDAIMDIQIHTATYHLKLEEAINGVASVTLKDAYADLDQAANLIDVVLNGGEAELSRVEEPLKVPALRLQAEEIKSLLIKLRELGRERQQRTDISGSGSALEYEFDAVFKEFLKKTRGLEETLERDEADNKKKSRRLFLGIMVVWTFLVFASTAGLWSRESGRKRAEEALRETNERLFSQTEELTEHRERLTELVEKRTAELTVAYEQAKTEMAERMQTCEMLKETERQISELSSKLLSAQEIERKRISMELHDELGQALTAMKLRIRDVEKGLREDQGAIRQECEGLLEYINQVIDDVRRLSLALSPTVLEDLGLASALHWLVSYLSKIPSLKITADIDDIDHLIPRNHWITIYRVMQEALTNVGKHAQAENVAVVVRRHDDRVAFSVEDDGKGFDPEQASMKNASEGFGLMTMNERVNMMGGILDLWSREEKGTRVTFSIPVQKGGA